MDQQPPTQLDVRASASKKNDQVAGSLGSSISLPKGGAAIRGIDRKFTANPDTGSLSIPIATSPGRSDFAPQLALSMTLVSATARLG